MPDKKIAELEGRLTAISDILLSLIAVLDTQGSIDIPVFSAYLKRRAELLIAENDSPLVQAKLAAAQNLQWLLIEELDSMLARPPR